MNNKDNVSYNHPYYTMHSSQLNMVNKIYNGVDYAVDYLVKMPRESVDTYNKRREIATLRNFVRRGVEAFVGMIFRKPLVHTGFPEEMIDLFMKIDKERTLNMFARDLATALVRDCKAYAYIDSSSTGDGLPYAQVIQRSQVINWRRNEDGTFAMVVVYSKFEEEDGDYTMSEYDRWQVFRDDGSIQTFRRRSDYGNGDITDMGTIYTEFDFCPIVEMEISDVPLLYDVAKLTAKHMNRTSLKDKYLDMAANPVPLFWGCDSGENGDPTKPVMVIGVDNAYMFDRPKDEADFEWRELAGTSISALQDDLTVIEEEITSGVIRAASSDSGTVKTATQSYYEAAESSNRVAVFAQSLEHGLNKMAEMFMNVMNLEFSPEMRILVNKDYNALLNNNDDMRLLWEVYLGGAMSVDTFLTSLEKYEIIDIGSVDDELERIKQDTFKPEAKGDTTSSTTDNRVTSVQPTTGN